MGVGCSVGPPNLSADFSGIPRTKGEEEREPWEGMGEKEERTVAVSSCVSFSEAKR
jgi:hypothetical protein